MKPKISTCINAIEQGVKQATILDGRISHSLILELFTEHGIGTQIYSLTMPLLKTIIDTWIFDLDNTLYSADSGIFQHSW